MVTIIFLWKFTQKLGSVDRYMFYATSGRCHLRGSEPVSSFRSLRLHSARLRLGRQNDFPQWNGETESATVAPTTSATADAALIATSRLPAATNCRRRRRYRSSTNVAEKKGRPGGQKVTHTDEKTNQMQSIER